MTLEEEDSPRKAQRSVHSGKPICLLEFSVVFTAECAYLFLGISESNLISASSRFRGKFFFNT